MREWLRDYADSLPLLPDRERDPNEIRAELLDQFYSKYPDDAVARFRQFAQGMMFLEEHMDAPELARWIVPGEERAVVRTSLLCALHKYFTQPTNRVPSLQEIADLAVAFKDDGTQNI